VREENYTFLEFLYVLGKRFNIDQSVILDYFRKPEFIKKQTLTKKDSFFNEH